MQILERYFAIKEQHPEILQDIKQGKYTEDPEFIDLIKRTDNSQSELILEALENIRKREESIL